MLGEAPSKNAWRQQTPEQVDWADRLRPGHPDKYFVVSCDNHVNEPADWAADVDKQYRDRLPHIVNEPDGTQWLISEGWAPQPVKIPNTRSDLLPTPESFEKFEFMATYTDLMDEEDMLRSIAGRDLADRIRDRESQGIDAELIFPNKGVLSFATPDSAFSGVMCRAWNRWARSYFASDWDRSLPLALIAAGDIENAIKEVHWAAEQSFHGLQLPSRPVYNRKDQPRHPLEYNDKSFEPLWAAIQETSLPITFHVGTGQDPRAVGGKGAAITTYICHSGAPTLEPMIQMISSGVLERFPGIRIAVIEAGIGWMPWIVPQMDYVYRAHHMWVRPVIPRLPSSYFRSNCAAAFIDEPESLAHAITDGFEDNLLWSSDYPHHEGSFPHCPANILRQMNDLTDAQRAKILGLNAMRIFNIKHV